MDRATFDARERPLAVEESRLREELAAVQSKVTAGQSAANRHAALVVGNAVVQSGRAAGW